MHQSLQGATFHIEHITPQSRGGRTLIDNLALACPACNLHKSDRVLAHDPETGQQVPLFNPRVDVWSEHFHWEGYSIRARTPIGRALINTLDLNHPRNLLIRQAEQSFHLFPPET
jgi:hypothetical protein